MTRPLSLNDLEALLEECSYKEGWTFELYDDGRHEGYSIRITAEVVNAYDHDTVMVIGVESYMPWFYGSMEFYRWLLWRIQRVEAHECHEWFQINGRAFKDPHAARAVIANETKTTTSWKQR